MSSTSACARALRALLLPFLLLLFAFLAATGRATADDRPRPDGHAPAGVMFDHMHKKGEWMIGIRSTSTWQSGPVLFGREEATDAGLVAAGFSSAPHRMAMHMVMLDLMYAPMDWLNLMVMPHYMTMGMKMRDLPVPAHGDHDEEAHDHGAGHGDHGNSSFSDTVVAALLRLCDTDGHRLHAGLGLSMPSGSVTENGPDGRALHYGMQVGSGTWDFIPSLTYTGHAARWGWGAQVTATMRLDRRNEAGFRFGDQLSATAWGSYRLTDWLSASLRFQHTRQGDIEGHYNRPHNHASPPDLQANYGGRFLDLGLGANLVAPGGRLAGQRLGIEWLVPVRQDPNGFQLKRQGALHLSWSAVF